MKKLGAMLILGGLMGLVFVCNRTTPLKNCQSGMMPTKEGCLPCDYFESWDAGDISLNECATICPNRMIVNGRCVLSTCPSKTFRDKDGRCPSCGDGAFIPPSAEECAKCSMIREMVNGRCVFKRRY